VFTPQLKQYHFLLLLVFSALSNLHALDYQYLKEYSLSKLEERKIQINDELNQLANLSLRGGMGSVGFQSPILDDKDTPYWVQINLDQIHQIDQIVLTPVLWRDLSQKDQVIANAFPEGFRVIVGQAENTKGTIVAEYTAEDQLLPRIAPVVVSFPKRAASWVRIETTSLSKRIETQKYTFQVSEIMVFSGFKNVALRCSSTVSHKTPALRPIPFRQRFITDGSTPYFMDSAGSKRSFPYLSSQPERPELYIDLGKVSKFSCIRLHAVEQANHIPQASAGDLGIPKHFKIYGANSSNFSDARLLLNFKWNTIYNISPIMEWPIDETSCRYIKLQVIEPNSGLGALKAFTRAGFAEIQLLNNGTNIALGKKVWDLRGKRKANKIYGNITALTDGYNLFGKIIPTRDWMNQLARRHDLNSENYEVNKLLAHGYTKQKEMLTRMKITTISLAAVVALILLITYVLRIKNEAQVRERIAANLHDELGANLHAIGILGDLAEDAIDHKEDLVDTLARIRKLTKNTGLAAYRCASMMKTKSHCDNLVEEMKQETERLLGEINYSISFEAEEILNQLKRRTRIDLILFLKECLVNIIRHSEASNVEITASANNSRVRLTVKDNGLGLNKKLPNSLARRSQLLKGKLTFDVPSKYSGLCITLTFKRRKWGVLR